MQFYFNIALSRGGGYVYTEHDAASYAPSDEWIALRDSAAVGSEVALKIQVVESISPVVRAG